MLSSSAIRPTTTARVRHFLETQHVEVRPWSGLDETYAHLYNLLNARKDDPEFWPSLSTLLSEIVNDTVRGSKLPAPQAELLASWDIEDLTRDLRTSLPGNGKASSPSPVKLFLEGLSAPVLGGFLLLGLTAAACDDDDTAEEAEDVDTETETETHMDTETETNSVTDSSWSDNCSLNDTSILWSSIQDSDLLTEDKETLCACFSSLTTDWNTGLTKLFQTGAPQEIADALENLIRCCASTPENLDVDYDENVQSQILENTLCGDVPIYKGVSFPRK